MTESQELLNLITHESKAQDYDLINRQLHIRLTRKQYDKAKMELNYKFCKYLEQKYFNGVLCDYSGIVFKIALNKSYKQTEIYYRKMSELTYELYRKDLLK